MFPCYGRLYGPVPPFWYLPTAGSYVNGMKR